jgi:hypothetical protein
VSACACRARILGQSVKRVICAMRDGTKRRRHDGRSMQGTCATASFVRSSVRPLQSLARLHEHVRPHSCQKCRLLRLWCSVACLSQLVHVLHGHCMATWRACEAIARATAMREAARECWATCLQTSVRLTPSWWARLFVQLAVLFVLHCVVSQRIFCVCAWRSKHISRRYTHPLLSAFCEALGGQLTYYSRLCSVE